MKKQISVIVPVYNGEKYIDIFMHNVIKQSFFEKLAFIFVDDGSDDDSYKVLKQYEKVYSNEIKVYTKQNSGVSSARNYGLEKVDSPYFTFADIDDILHPSLMQALYVAIEDYNADMVFSNICKIDSNKVTKDMLDDFKEKSCNDCLKYSSHDAIALLLQDADMNSVYGKMYRTSSLINVRFNESLAISEDKLFVFECFVKSNVIIGSKQAFYYYIQQPLSAMTYVNSRNKIGQDLVLEIIDEKIKTLYPDLYPLSVAIRARIHTGAFIKVIQNEQYYKERCRKYRCSVQVCPIKNIFKYIHGKERIKIFFVRYIPQIYFIVRFLNRKNLVN